MSPKKPIEFPQQGTFELLGAAQAFASEDIVERPDAVPGLRLGTSAFTAAGWPGTFYPAGMQPRDYLSYYATKFNSVEVDSTFYRTPPASTVKGWYEKTPAGFLAGRPQGNRATDKNLGKGHCGPLE